MENRGERSKLVKVIISIANGIQLSWFDLLGFLWSAGKLVRNDFAMDGIYEVLEYETTLELHDRKGKKATINKRQKVRYLQDHIIAYQDQAWGDGDILLDYKCSPGIPVDQYQFGHKTIILISLRKEKNKGSIDEFNIQWKMDNSFLTDVESWATVILHKTKHLRVNIIFPSNRSPSHIALLNRKRKAVKPGGIAQKQLPDGRWQICWEMYKPKLYEEYILEWKW